jgi:mannose-1-phosphate guanylyltransferase/phosphomannomutase
MSGDLRAMVLAAGAGTRLRPISLETPKPMVPVANRPVLHHVLANLARHGIKDVMLNLHSHPDQVRRFCGDGRKWGLRISYSMEKKLLGTAGAVKKCESFFKNGPVLIMSGDGMSDVNISRFYKFHRERKSFASQVTKKIDARFEYGVPLTGKNGRIKGFLEKPSWGDVLSNQVNTGIYLFEPGVFKYIPKGVYDFGHELWPKLLKLKKPIFAWEWKGYWCDIGNLTEFRKSQIAALNGEIDIEVPGKTRRKGIFIEDGAKVHPRAKLIAPCLIGKDAHIGSGAQIGPYTVIGEKARIGASAALKKCIIFNRAIVGRGAFLTNTVLGAGSRIQTHFAVHNAEILKSRT